MNNKIPPGIKIIDDCIKNSEKIINYLNNNYQWQQSMTFGDNPVSEKRTSKTIFIPMLSWKNDEIIHEMNKKIYNEFDKYAIDYRFSFSEIEDVSIQKYDSGDYYKPHTDAGPGVPRIVSALLYLNTVKNGGETHFVHFKYKISPVAGRLVIFPSNYAYQHEALPPKNEIKIAAAYWARG